ncbi:MAG TPA: serine/threonine-protein kinase, partial [Myxococcales bacterium]|nr:serine/threonine-protein kinase [Myxococcales bacterium]
MPPKIIAGRYRLERQLAPGGMGLVFVAYDQQMQRDVALKMLRPDHGPLSIERFRREARAITELSHENIVTILDSGDDGGEPYIVQELLRGRSLRRVLAEKPLPLGTAIELGLQCARGLSAAHARGILHRDLKPENLYVTEHGHLKILDFGLARMIPVAGSTAETLSDSSDDGLADLTVTGQILGTPAYMAPEQARGTDVGLSADMFMFGLVLYETIAGKKAFPGDNRFDVATDIVFNEPPPLSSAVPAPLRDLIERCLRKVPSARPTAPEAMAVLEKVLSTAPRRDLAIPGGLRGRRRLDGRQWAGVALLAAVAGCGVWWWMQPAAIAAPRQKVVMVLPFATTGSPDTSHGVERILHALSEALTQGNLRAVPPETTLQILEDEGQTAASPEELA